MVEQAWSTDEDKVNDYCWVPAKNFKNLGLNQPTKAKKKRKEISFDGALH